ncbi:cytochrome P450 4c21-like [Panonychus citri]|uniref:cytochrome P450 4c21-like n=1 Tax=Panonychus citri TaxID=50023 RepID=UPI002307246B|nr:cytochrome P450 4c21-like [Panonychus citri]
MTSYLIEKSKKKSYGDFQSCKFPRCIRHQFSCDCFECFCCEKLFNFIGYLKPFFKLPKDPKCSFLFGDSIQFIPGLWNTKLSSVAITNFMISNASNHQIKSGLHAFWLGWWPMVVINDHKCVEELISYSAIISKPPFYKFMGLKDGLITSTGEKWKMRRKMIEPFFVSKQQKRFALTIDEVFDLLVNEDDFCNQGKYLTLCHKVHLATADIIMKVTADLPIDSEKERKLDSVEAIDLMERSTIVRLCNPFLWSDRIFNMTRFGKKCTKMANLGYEFIEIAINNNLDHNSNDIDDQSGLFSPFNLVNILNSHKGKIDSSGISEEILTTVAAGHETTATALKWTLFILGNRIDIQEKLYQEISSIFDDKESVNDIVKIKDCEYLDKCLKESMRLYPPVPFIGRELDEPIEINGYYLPKGPTTMINILSIHRDPRIYPNPTEYDPERFDPSNLPNIPKGAYIPFGVMPRNCIGYRFALIEMKIFLIHLIRRYEIFSAKKLEDVSFTMDTSLKPSFPLEIMLRKRSN